MSSSVIEKVPVVRDPRLWGYMAEYDSPADILHAAEKVRDAGFSRWDCHTPFPVHGLDGAMGMKKTILPWIVLGAGLTGLTVATVLQWYVNSPTTQSASLGLVSGYPLRISGKPYWSVPPNVPVMFELTVLLSALAAFFGVWILSRLPRFHHPAFSVARFKKVTDDKFFIVVEAEDEKFDAQRTRELLDGTHPAAVEEVLDEDTRMSPKILIGLILVAVTLSLVPFALIARSRASKSTRTAPHLVLDMDKQPRFDPQAGNLMFADGRAMRPMIQGTLAREDLVLRNEPLVVAGEPRMVDGEVKNLVLSSPEQYAAVMYGRVRAAGMSDDAFNAVKPPEKPNDAAQAFYINGVPEGVAVTEDFVRRGQERFNIYCAPCHGQTGYGDGMIQRRAQKLQEVSPDAVAAWVQPSNLNDDERRARPAGHVFNTITNGIRNMPAYDKQISVMDRWAIVHYVKALQRSQGAARPAGMTADASGPAK